MIKEIFMATNNIESVDRYPYSLGSFGSGTKYVILENDYFLYFGKRKKSDNLYELYAKVTSRYYPHDTIVNGEKVNLNVYKIGELPTASWTLDSKNKTIYLFLSNTTSYLHDQPELPEEIQNNFDESEPDLTQGLIVNKDNIYDVISELPFFDPNRSYRQFAITKSGYNGKLYQKKTADESIAGVDQKDPFLDKNNWELYTFEGTTGDDGQVIASYVDLQTNQSINGQKTFLDGIYKDNYNTNPSPTEVINFKEAERQFVKKGEIVENSNKVGNFNPADIRRGNEQVVVVTNTEGKIDDSFLNANIISTAKNIIVDRTKADGITVFATIQEAYEHVSKMVRLANVTIQVVDGIYNKSNDNAVLNFTSIYDCSKISIIGNINNPERCIIKLNNGQTGLYYTGKGLAIDGFKFELQEADKGDSIGIRIGAGANIVFGHSIVVDGCKVGLDVSENSYVSAENMQVTNCETAYHIDASTANLNFTKAQSCYTCVDAENNAVVYARGAIYDKGSIQSTNTVGFKASYGAVIKALETSTTTASLDKQYNDAVANTPNTTLGIIQYT